MELLRTVYLSLPSLMNVGGLLFLLLFIYAVMGVSIFGRVVHHAELTEDANFDTWPMAMLTLVRMLTGEEWHLVMDACRVQPPECSLEADNCGNDFALPYFVSFVFTVRSHLISYRPNSPSAPIPATQSLLLSCPPTILRPFLHR